MPEDSKAKTPQEIKRQKLRQQFEEATGITFPEGDVFGQAMAAAVDDAVRTGARRVNPDEEDSPIQCNAEWHFSRFNGPGRTVAPLLYQISFHLAKKTGSFHLSVPKAANFLNTKPDNIYEAAHLLVASGFWQVIEAEIGTVVKYRPVGHKEWARTHSGLCTQMLSMGYTQEETALAELGRMLHGIMGGAKFFPNIVRGFRNAAKGRSDEEICQQAKLFMDSDAGKGSGKGRHKRLREFLLALEPISTDTPPQKPGLVGTPETGVGN